MIDADLLAKVRSAKSPPASRPSSKAPQPGNKIDNVAKIAEHAPPVPRAGNDIVATSPERGAARRQLNPRRRSATLPRPRLTRGGAKADRAPAIQRGVSADLKTLDFFIERGFTESAIALLAELERRYPNNEQLRQRKQRIASMPR